MSKITKWRLNPVWHRVLYSWIHMATVGVKGLNLTKISILPPNGMICLSTSRRHYQWHYSAVACKPISSAAACLNFLKFSCSASVVTTVRHFGHFHHSFYLLTRSLAHSLKFLFKPPIWVTARGYVVTAFIFGENLRPILIAVLVMFQYFGHELFRTILSLIVFTARCTLVQSAVLRLHVVCLSVCLSVSLFVCNVGELWSHRLEFFENNFTIS